MILMRTYALLRPTQSHHLTLITFTTCRALRCNAAIPQVGRSPWCGV